MMTWLRTVLTHKSPRKQGKAPLRVRLQVEHLEDRRVMSVTYHGGALMPHVEVQGFYVGDQWSGSLLAGYLEGFLGKIVNSTYMDALNNAGYSVGRGSSSGGK